MTGAGSAAVPGPLVPGRTVLSAKALNRVTEATAAAELRVPAREVRASIGDAQGRLSLSVSAPTALEALGQRGERLPLAERLEGSRRSIASRVEQLTGHLVGRCELTVTGAQFPPERRVR